MNESIRNKRDTRGDCIMKKILVTDYLNRKKYSNENNMLSIGRFEITFKE